MNNLITKVDVLNGIVFCVIYVVIFFYISKTRFLSPKFKEDKTKIYFRTSDKVLVFSSAFVSLVPVFFLWLWLIKKPDNFNSVIALSFIIPFIFGAILIYISRYLNVDFLVYDPVSKQFEYSNWWGRKFNFTWADITSISRQEVYTGAEVSIATDYNLIRVGNKKIKFNQFWSGENEFRRLAIDNLPKEIRKKAMF